jgi:hypothetical protein
MTDIATLTPGEQRASDTILEAMSAIRNIEEDDTEPLDDRRRLTANGNELVDAVHVLQSFVKQHVLHRINPDDWSDWWESENSMRPKIAANGS